MNQKTELEIKLDLSDNNASNLFLRKFFAVLRSYKINFTATPAKVSKKRIVALGLLTIFRDTIGVTCKYEKKGTIKSLIFNEVPIQLSDLIKGCVNKALKSYQNNFNQFKIGYLFESSSHYIKPFSGNNFEISLNKNDYYSNTISFNGEGFDLEDIYTFNQFIFESMVDMISLYHKIPFDTRHQFSDRYSSLPTPEELINTDPNFIKYKEIQLDEKLIEILEKVSIIKPEHSNDKIYRMARLFRDGLRIEKYGYNNFSINFKEAAHSLYMSCFEVMANTNNNGKRCDECGQTMYKISEGVANLISEMSGSENLRKFIKKEYAKRSKYLHTGKYFSANNLYVGKYIPQLSSTTEHGHILQVNHWKSLDFVKDLLKGIMLKEFSRY